MTEEITLLPLDLVAEQMETTELNVLMHIKRNKIKAEEHDGKWFVCQASLDNFLTSPGRTETIVTCKTHCCHTGCGSCS